MYAGVSYLTDAVESRKAGDEECRKDEVALRRLYERANALEGKFKEQ